jgi:spore coat protein CotH
MRRAIWAVAALVAAPFAQAADPIFDQGRLHETVLELDPADWQALRNDYWSNQYYAANITLDGEALKQVGIRSRGAGSRSGQKPGLKVDVNKYVKGQEFHGYKTLVLDNGTQDPSAMRERLAFAVFEAAGIAAPQISHSRLTVNGEYWGLYTLVESVSKPFLKARIGEESGNLFDYEYVDKYTFTYKGDDPGAYIPSPFQPETNEDKLDGTGLVELIKAINETPESTYAAGMAAYLDTRRFLTHVAAENALAEMDGIVGDFGLNNFYLYQYGGQKKFVFIPWDKDTCFTAASWPVLRNMDTNVLTKKLMTDATLKQYYQSEVKRVTTSFVSSTWLTPKLDAGYLQIKDAALADTKKPHTNADFENAIAGLRGIIAARPADVTKQVP